MPISEEMKQLIALYGQAQYYCGLQTECEDLPRSGNVPELHYRALIGPIEKLEAERDVARQEAINFAGLLQSTIALHKDMEEKARNWDMLERLPELYCETGKPVRLGYNIDLGMWFVQVAWEEWGEALQFATPAAALQAALEGEIVIDNVMQALDDEIARLKRTIDDLNSRVEWAEQFNREKEAAIHDLQQKLSTRENQMSRVSVKLQDAHKQWQAMKDSVHVDWDLIDKNDYSWLDHLEYLTKGGHPKDRW